MRSIVEGRAQSARMIHRDESEERFTRRLEAFSDIVIGFSLAQLGISLTVGKHGADVFTEPLKLIGFLFPFAIICSLWFFHHRLFSRAFVPKALPVVLNFLWLAAVVLLVYVAESYVKFAVDPVTIRSYFACYAVVYGLLALQSFIAAGYAKERNDATTASVAMRGAVFMAIWTFPFVASFVVALVSTPGPVYSIVIPVSFASAGIATGILRGRYRQSERAMA